MCFALAGLAVLAAQVPGPAQVGGRVIPEQGYEITPQLGPWMICTTYYQGEDARKNAEKLLTELRTNYHLPAYLFNYSDQERAKEQERIQKERQRIQQLLDQQADALRGMGAMQIAPVHIRTRRFEDQCAVLIGGYPDEKAARKDLDRIKRLPPPDPRRVPLHTIYSRQVLDKPGEQIFVSPFAKAFVVPNPMVKQTPANDPHKPDPFLKRLNAGESLSLLRCSRCYTLVVSEFHGVTSLEERSASSKFLGWLKGGQTETLNAAALNAHNWADRLHKWCNLETYVLHTRYYSLVTVGSFDSLDDPRLKAMQQQLAQLPQQAPELRQVPMLPQALPLEVPRP
jgi:hypothetical protein